MLLSPSGHIEHQIIEKYNKQIFFTIGSQTLVFFKWEYWNICLTLFTLRVPFDLDLAISEEPLVPSF